VVFWRNSAGGLITGPDACPRLGALLDKCLVIDGTMYDDGVLILVGLPTDGEVATDQPALPARLPLSESGSAVISKPGICEPEDVIANYLDLWHGS
jgi:hypothetical protein